MRPFGERQGRRRRGIAMVPTLLTLGNGVSGVLAISKMIDAVTAAGPEEFTEKVVQAAWLIFLGMIFDALDGRVARLTNQTTEFGVQLDACTDVVTFGVAPALLVKVVYENAMSAAGLTYSVKLTFCLCALYAVCAILRLARFAAESDAEDKSHNTFAGLPSPAAAGVIASAVFFLFETGEGVLSVSFSRETALFLKRLFIVAPPLLGLFMVSRIRYVHLVSRFVRGRKTFNFLIQGILGLFLAAFCHEWAIFLFFTGYVLSGPVLHLAGLVRGRRERRAARKRGKRPDEEDAKADEEGRS